MQQNRRAYLTGAARTAALAFAAALIAVLPVLCKYHGNLYLIGDYMTQILPFMKESRRMLLSGAPWWSHTSFLGCNFIGVYAYYTLGSPFFWPLVLLSERWMGVGLSVMFLLKHAAAAASAYLYLRTHIRTEHLVCIGALIYTFSGATLDATYYYIFLDTIAFFPLLLLFADAVLGRKRQAGFALVVLLNALVNYYLFVGTSVFFLLYLFFRVRCAPETGWKDALRCLLVYALGALGAMALILPALCTLTETGKATGSFANVLLGALSTIPQAVKILKVMVLPNEGILHSAFGFAYATFCSNACFLPFFGALFLFAALRRHDNIWQYKLLRLLFILSLVPFGNGLFSLFSNLNYTRWWYAFVLVGVCTALYMLEQMRDDPVEARTIYRRSAGTIRILALCVTLPLPAVKAVLCYVPAVRERIPQGARASLTENGLLQKFCMTDLRYAAVLILMCALTYIPLYFALRDRWIYRRTVIVPVLLICALSSGLYLNNECAVFSDENAPRAEKVSMVSDAKTAYTARTQFKDSYSNYGMLANAPSVNSFNSFKSEATMAFCRLAGMDAGSITREYFTTPAVQAVLSIRIVQQKDGTQTDAPYYVPLGFCYDRYIPAEELPATKDKRENDRRLEQMCSACYLDKETAAKLRGVVSPLETPADWKASAAQKRAGACTDIRMDSTGLSAHSQGTERRLLYFSIPHDRGWRAFVNGEETEIYTINGGMMGIVVPQGQSEIHLRFETPGLKAGIFISAAAWLGILILGIAEKKKKGAAK